MFRLHSRIHVAALSSNSAETQVSRCDLRRRAFFIAFALQRHQRPRRPEAHPPAQPVQRLLSTRTMSPFLKANDAAD